MKSTQQAKTAYENLLRHGRESDWDAWYALPWDDRLEALGIPRGWRGDRDPNPKENTKCQ